MTVWWVVVACRHEARRVLGKGLFSFAHRHNKFPPEPQYYQALVLNIMISISSIGNKS